MTLYNILDRYLFLPLGDLVYGSQVYSKFNELIRIDKLSESELFELQNQKLQTMIHHCYDTVPYYRRLFDAHGINPNRIKTKEDLSIIPILTKQIIRDNYDDLFSTAVNKKLWRVSLTGGSTGVPMNYCSDKAEWSYWKAASFRAWKRYGLNLGDPIFTLAGTSLNKTQKTFSLKGIYDRVILRNHKYSSSDISDETLAEYYQLFCKLKPKAIRGYGSSLYYFAQYIDSHQLNVPKVKVVLTTGEVLMPEYRRKLEEVFNAPLFDAYGAGDGGILAFECEKHCGFHITEDACVIEITDSEGNVLPEGMVGNVCTTNLNNFAFPFLRYHLGDMAYINHDRCSCGRNSRLIGGVIGRVGRLVYTKDGKAIAPVALSMLMYPDRDYHKKENQIIHDKIEKFQIRQDQFGDIVILIKLKSSEEIKSQFDYIISNFTSRFEGSKVELQFVEEIPSLPSGKEDFCVSEFERGNK